jgi:DNA-binding NtrC family response regulator
MKSLLIVLNEDFLAKGIALALIDYFQSIHTTKNPYEAIEIITNQKIDILISDVNFKTINPERYVEAIKKKMDTINTVIFLENEGLDIDNFSSGSNIIVQPKPISLKYIIDIVASINKNT